ncbi:peptidase [Sphaerisporangium rufum]|uniref:Peptidase n=1 Tax=Sphaerisporangium rufum TaxID=1381558 RepID=A0A919R606_9ACTN|nr:CPBP family intramembrane glutamic endopeptidase [Sphaerisporangium rufum]GII77782.1 peptidase [Sphaerisporangium rufum]
MRNRGVIVYLVLTFGLTWSLMVGVRFGLGMPLADPRAQLFFAFVPALVAIVVRRWVTREGFADAGLALRLRAAWRYYLIAWFGPLGLLGAGILVAVAGGWYSPDTSALRDFAPGVPPVVLIALLLMVALALTPVYWGEEFGWTSYLRLRIHPGRPLLATLATGLIWAVWHFPLAFLGYADYRNVLIGLLWWTAGFVCQEVMLTWLRLRSGTIWTTSLAHAGNNMVLSLVADIMLSGGAGLDDLVVMPIMLVPQLAVAAWILLSGRYRAAAPAAPPAAVPVASGPRLGAGHAPD